MPDPDNTSGPIKRTNLLFASPVVPRLNGSGVGMRSAAHIVALADLFDVDLVVFESARSPTSGGVDPEVAKRCRRVMTFKAEENRFGTFYHQTTNAQLKAFARAVH